MHLDGSLVDVDGLSGDLRPVELLDTALPARATELPSPLRIPCQFVDLGRQSFLELGHRSRIVGIRRVLRDQVTCHAVHHNLGNTAHC